MIKVHHINCGTLCPVAGRLVAGVERKLICHCLLIETEQGLVLVDTGFGTEDVRDPMRRLSKSVRLMRPKLELAETAIEQIKGLGFQTDDVRHIIVTHLDFDHAGGLSDFPNAKVHVFENEYETAISNAQDLMTRSRYRPVQWSHGPDWQKYRVQGENWFGFEAVRDLRGLPPEILMIPLPGHTMGHCGVAVQTPGGWILHAGDAYFYHGEMNGRKYECPPMLRAFQRLVAMNNRLRLRNQGRLRDLVWNNNGEVEVFCAHDSTEFQMKLKRRPS